jgi:zinc finger protein 830
MSDVRALLKTKRQQIRVTHPLAFYSTSGQLRCKACGTNVKHTSAWEGHLGSKAHRTNAARLKDEERSQEAREEEKSGEKRSAEPVDVDLKKRRVDTQLEESETNIPIVTEMKSSEFPIDFFSDPSLATLPTHDSDDDAELVGVSVPNLKQDKSLIDQEWEIFEKATVHMSDYQETYKRATVVAEPVISTEKSEGFLLKESADGPDPMQKDIEEARQRKEQDERYFLDSGCISI